MAQTETDPERPVLGFFTVATIWGAALGFAFVDLSAAPEGYDWSSRHYAEQTLLFTLGGACLGMLFGAIGDRFARDANRMRSLQWVWGLLAAAVFAYWVLRPIVQGAR